ncbi:Hypothetical predicted protein [Octopus vulgaris]|uniref:Transmembrane protein n=1 Tax=Octopus vulgaris TaxID=6645 RepID=A0AA36AI43_OCTVU|nr:Hypothetical predicted protein [Octopus vulgaris]
MLILRNKNKRLLPLISSYGNGGCGGDIKTSLVFFRLRFAAVIVAVADFVFVVTVVLLRWRCLTVIADVINSSGC